MTGDITPDLAAVLVDQQQHGHIGLLFFAGLTPAHWSGGVVDGQFDYRCIGCRQHFLDCICIVEVMEVRLRCLVQSSPVTWRPAPRPPAYSFRTVDLDCA